MCMSTTCLGSLQTDINRDGIVNFSDFAILSDQWLNEKSNIISLNTLYEYGCDSVSYLDGHEYPPGIPRTADMAFCDISDGMFERNECDDGTSLCVYTQSKEGTFYAVKRKDVRDIYKSTDGRTWTKTATTYFVIKELWALQNGVLLMSKYLENPPKIYRSVDAGVNWTEVLSYAPDSSIRTWSVTQAPHGTIMAVEYSQHPNKGRNIYRSTDEGANWTNVYHESGDITHFHLAAYHSITGTWLAQCGDNEPRCKILISVDDGQTWEPWAPHAQGKEFFNTAQMIDYGDPTKFFFGDDAGSMVGFLDVTNGNVTQKYFDHDQRAGRHLVFSALYHKGVFYGAFFEQGDAPYDATIIASEDAENWAVYHRFTPDDGADFRGISGFVGAGRDGKIHCRTPGAVTWHFMISPANIHKTRAILLEPGTTNLLDTSEKSSFEVDGSGMEVIGSGVSGARSTSEHSHGSASYNMTGPNSVQGEGRNLWSTAGIRPVEGSIYCGSFKMKAPTLFEIMPRWRLEGAGYYTDYYGRITTGHRWATYYLPAYTAPAGGGPDLKVSTFVFGKSHCPYDVYVDDIQVVKDEPPTSWQLGGVPRSDTTYSCDIALPEAWTNVLFIFPEFYYKLLEGSGPLFIRSWVRDADNYAELYFDCSDNRFKLRRTVSGIQQHPVESEAQTFQRKALIRFALRCSPNFLKLSLINGRSHAEHLIDAPFASLYSHNVRIKYGDKDGSNGFPLFLAIDSDLLYESVEDDLTTKARMDSL